MATFPDVSEPPLDIHKGSSTKRSGEIGGVIYYTYSCKVSFISMSVRSQKISHGMLIAAALRAKVVHTKVPTSVCVMSIHLSHYYKKKQLIQGNSKYCIVRDLFYTSHDTTNFSFTTFLNSTVFFFTKKSAVLWSRVQIQLISCFRYQS